VREAQVSADRPFVVYADGDPIGQLPATFTVEPAAVRIMVPR
jgi:diacylglycerol kinase family enzyme